MPMFDSISYRRKGWAPKNEQDAKSSEMAAIDSSCGGFLVVGDMWNGIHRDPP